MKKNTQLFGILNITPDSCYDGGQYFDLELAVKRGIRIEQEGADYIDIGGESTKPNAVFVTEDEELRRVIPVIKALKSQIKIPISIDTYKPNVAEAALLAGATIINDISGLSNPRMVDIALEFDVPVCVMHMQGNPATMQIAPDYPRGVTIEMLEWFDHKIESLLAVGMNPSRIILDPGIGFGKTAVQNVELLQNLPLFKKLGFPLFLGLSRKSFIMHYISKPREELLSATLAVASYAIQQRVDYLRVHDVGSHRDAITILDGILS
jgi:dihydropteroate synthase